MASSAARLVVALVAATLTTAVVACGDGSDAPAPSRPDRLRGAIGAAEGSLESLAGSPRELVEQALTAFERRDTAALVELLVDRDEFMRIVYPELGAHFAAARDTRSETKAFLWETQRLNALKGMRKALREVGGEKLELVSIEFREGEKRFPSYRLFEGTQVRVRDSSGASATLHALGSIIERERRYKLMSFRDLD